MNLTTIEKLTASVITNFIAQHFNNEVRHTTYYKQNLKRVGNLYAKELEKAELKEFDLLDERQPDALHLISSNQLEFIEEIDAALSCRPSLPPRPLQEVDAQLGTALEFIEDIDSVLSQWSAEKKPTALLMKGIRPRRRPLGNTNREIPPKGGNWGTLGPLGPT